MTQSTTPAADETTAVTPAAADKTTAVAPDSSATPDSSAHETSSAAGETGAAETSEAVNEACPVEANTAANEARPVEADTAADLSADDATPAFSDLGLSESVLEAVGDLGYEMPSPVQAQAIPYALEGRDLLAAAQTGTGKTAAFLLPTMSRLPRSPRHHGPLMLVVTPTRELAQQIEDVCETIAKRTHHRSVTVVGGVSYEPQKAALHRGCDILVATPGRLVDLIEQGEARLDEVQVLVLDEADRMLDMGFLPAMRKIVGQTPSSRQTMLFSATLDEKAIGGIRDLVSDPAVVEIAHKGTVADTIDQFALPVSPEVKNGLLAEVLKAEGPSHVIVFTRTKHRADACCRRLRRAGISCAPIHGNRSQNQRERALASFRDGKTDVLVATDVLARGIDVSDVRYVVNFDVPADPEDYIHRIGRTGRAGETGWALTFVTTDDFADLRDCERLMGQVVPTYERAGAFDLGAEPPELDPERSAEKPRPGEPGSGKRRKRGGRRKPAGESPSAGRGGSGSRGGSRGEQGSARGAGQGRKRAGQSAGRGGRVRQAEDEDVELLSEKERAAIERSRGRGQGSRDGRRNRGGEAAARDGRTRQGEDGHAAQGGRGAGSEQNGRTAQGGRDSQHSRSSQGGRRAQGSRSSQGGRGRQATQSRSGAGNARGGATATKPRRRPGDRQGRNRGIY